VSYAADGQIQSVKYQLLDPMLLNEVQRQHAEIGDLQEKLRNQHGEIGELQEELRNMKDALVARSEVR
jgi:peptidoglycan hydrolase CwlO-like protein